jgi:hypothetical protein
LAPAEGLPVKFKPLSGQFRRRIRGPSNNVTHEHFCGVKSHRAVWSSNGVDKRTHALHTTERCGVCRRHERPLLQLRTAKEHHLVRNHGRIRPVILHVLKKLNAARWLSGLRQHANERVGIHVVVNLMGITPVARLLKRRAENRRDPVQSRVCGFSVSE